MNTAHMMPYELLRQYVLATSAAMPELSCGGSAFHGSVAMATSIKMNLDIQ